MKMKTTRMNAPRSENPATPMIPENWSSICRGMCSTLDRRWSLGAQARFAVYVKFYIHTNIHIHIHIHIFPWISMDISISIDAYPVSIYTVSKWKRCHWFFLLYFLTFTNMHRVRKKRCHLIFCRNFAES